MFKERGNVSSKHIQGINNAILALNTIPNQDKPLSDAPSTKSCGGCLKLFKGKACPVPCTTCAKFFHKTTCWKSHQCGGISSTSSPPSITSTISPVTFSSLQPLAFSAHQPITFSSSQPPSRTLPVKRTAANITCFEIDSDDDEELSPPTVSTKQPTVTLHPHLLEFIPSSLPISAPPSISLPGSSTFSFQTASTSALQSHPFQATIPGPTPVISAPDPSFSLPAFQTPPIISLPPASQPPPKKQKKNSVPVSKEAIENELLRRELNAASARVTSLDRELTSYKETVAILSERIKYFEDQHTRQVHDHYFSQEQVSENTPDIPTYQPSPAPPAAPAPPSPTSCPPPAAHTEPETRSSETRPQSPCPTSHSDRTPPVLPSDYPPPGPAVPPPTEAAPRPSVPAPSGHCNCVLELAAVKFQIHDINQQLALLSALPHDRATDTPSGTQPEQPRPGTAPGSQPAQPGTPPGYQPEQPGPGSAPGPQPAQPGTAPGYQPEQPRPDIAPGSQPEQPGIAQESPQEQPPPEINRNYNTRIRNRPRRRVPPSSPPLSSGPSVWLPGRAPSQPHHTPSSWPPLPARHSYSRSERNLPRHEPVNLIDLN